MLKIKDNVDLKELEKFGIKQAPDIKGYWGLCKHWKNEFWYYTITFEEPKKEIKIINWNAETGDILYDLIQAGLVEKVEEGQDIWMKK